MKYIYPTALAAAFIIVGIAAYTQYGGSSYTTPATPATVTIATTTVDSGVATSSQGSTTQQAPGTYTLAQIAAHNSASDCWTTINGSVYNLTPFIPEHPGGEQILAICGIDGTSAFESQHGNNRQANSILAELKVGTLAN